MRRAFPPIVLLFSLFAIAHAQPYSIELDLDGVLGNGPDIVSAQPGDTLAVDVWCTGTGYAYIGIGVSLCSDMTFLQFEQIESMIPPCWSVTDPESLGSGCWRTQGGAFCFENLPPTVLYGVAHYTVTADQTCGWINADPTESGWLNSSFASGLFENNTSAGVLVNTTEDCLSTSTEITNWGGIKTLFR